MKSVEPIVIAPPRLRRNASSRVPDGKELTPKVCGQPLFGFLKFIFGNRSSPFLNQQKTLVGKHRNRPQGKPVSWPTLLNGMNIGVQISKRTRFRAAAATLECLDTTENTGLQRAANSREDFRRQQIKRLCTPIVCHGFKVPPWRALRSVGYFN